ncbi:hypothetical protein SMICM304S_09818 [Streptomyces microflavus]
MSSIRAPSARRAATGYSISLVVLRNPTTARLSASLRRWRCASRLEAAVRAVYRRTRSSRCSCWEWGEVASTMPASGATSTRGPCT